MRYKRDADYQMYRFCSCKTLCFIYINITNSLSNSKRQNLWVKQALNLKLQNVTFEDRETEHYRLIVKLCDVGSSVENYDSIFRVIFKLWDE